MGYAIYLISREKLISKEDFDKAFSNLSIVNQKGNFGIPPCDLEVTENYIRVSGSFQISGHLAEGFVLNLLMCFLDLDYKIKVLCHDLEYGSESDWNWLNSIRINKKIYG